MDEYKILGRIGEGAHGVVFKAKQISTNQLVALKKIPLKRLEEGIPNTALREIKALQQIENHDNIVQLMGVIPQGMGFMLVFEYMVTDLSKVIYNTEVLLTEQQIKCYMVMILKGVEHCHRNHIMHRDLKPANLLISSRGILKIADFGLARVFENDREKLYSHQVATRWYRAPELLFGAHRYTEGVDLWAIGCIFAELVTSSPLFPGETDIEQICCVQRVLGTPTEEDWPAILHDLPDYNKISFRHFEPTPFEQIIVDAADLAIDLIKSLLVYPTEKRMSAENALLHDYFFTEPSASPLNRMADLVAGFSSPRKQVDPMNLLAEIDLPIEACLPPNDLKLLWKHL